MFCTHCGHPNKDDARFCAKCGHALGDATMSMPPVETSEEDLRDEFPFPHDELEPGQALLLVKRGPNAGSTFLLEDAASVGREPASAVFLDDVTVSRAHAIFERRGAGAWFVRDLGSLNGTYVNGEQVDETALATGDEVQIGKFKLAFFASETPGG